MTDKEVRRFVRIKPARVGSKAWKEQQERRAMEARARVSAHTKDR